MRFRSLSDLFIRALLGLSEIYRQSGDHEKAIGLTQRLLAVDPLQEIAHRQLMELYAQVGQREAALEQFKICKDLLQEELAVEPLEETTALFLELRGNGNGGHPTPTKAEPNGAPRAASASRVTSPPLQDPWQHLGLPAQKTSGSPEIPSIVILPFDNLTRDADQNYFAHGITDDITTELSKVPGIFVIARNSAYAYQGRAVPIREIAAELGVAFVLEGSVRRELSTDTLNWPSRLSSEV